MPKNGVGKLQRVVEGVRGGRAGSLSAQRNRELAGLRRRQATASLQEVGPIPPVSDVKLRMEVTGSLQRFAEVCFPAACNLAWADYHLELFRGLDHVIRTGSRMNVIMPRGGGKTTLLIIAAMWCLFTGRKRFLVLIAASETLAEDLLNRIKDLIFGSPTLPGLFPELMTPILKVNGESRRCAGQTFLGAKTRIAWDANRIRFPVIPGAPGSGATIKVAGLTGSGIRGLSVVQPDGRIERPDLVLLDDPQTKESARSVLQTAERLSLIKEDISGMEGPGGQLSLLMASTIIRKGDLPDLLNDPVRHPRWKTILVPMLESFPTDMEAWDDYWRRYTGELQEGGTGEQASRWYVKNRKKMDAGAVATWPARTFGCASAVEYALRKYFDDPAGFSSEYQNDPPSSSGDDLDFVLQPADLAGRVSGAKQFVLPQGTQLVTAGVDVQQRMLFYVVRAWKRDSSSCVVDYGTWPPQSRRIWTYKDSKETLDRRYGLGTLGSLRKGMLDLLHTLATREWKIAGQTKSGAKHEVGTMVCDRVFIDRGYKPELVNEVARMVGSTVLPCIGKAPTARQRPFAEYYKRPFEKHGDHWILTVPGRGKEPIRFVLVDANYWKSKVWERYILPMGEPGAAMLFGDAQSDHRLFAAHIADSEVPHLKTADGRTIREWELRQGRDNHWLDADALAMAAASYQGVNLSDATEGSKRRGRKRLSFAKIANTQKPDGQGG